MDLQDILKYKLYWVKLIGDMGFSETSEIHYHLLVIGKLDNSGGYETNQMGMNGDNCGSSEVQ